MSPTVYNRISSEEVHAIASTSESIVTFAEDTNAVPTGLCSPVCGGIQSDVQLTPNVSEEQQESKRRKGVALPCRKPTSSSSIQQAILDSLFCIPALCFIVYGILLCNFHQSPSDSMAASRLQAFATFGPTLFPIAYTATLANLLKAISQWKLEHGVTVLDLHYLQSSRTVFSAVATIVKTRVLSSMALLIMVLWLPSPIGSQASLRAVGQGPQMMKFPWLGRFLNTSGEWSINGIGGPDVESTLTVINDAFKAAILSPVGIKRAHYDGFGNVKIPMTEPLFRSNISSDQSGWYEVKDRKDLVYSSLTGLPITTLNELNSRINYTFTMPTSYLSVHCTISDDHPKMSRDDWYSHSISEERVYREFMDDADPAVSTVERNGSYDSNRRIYFNGNGLLLKLWRSFEERWPMDLKQPLGFEFESFHTNGVTKATCGVDTTYVEANISCSRQDCKVDHIRQRQKLDSRYLTVLHRPCVLDYGFFGYFVNSTSGALDSGTRYNAVRTSALECFLLNPDSPYAWTFNAECTDKDTRPVPMWNISETLLSQRMTQLLNTFWINGVAPSINSGGFQFLSTEDEGVRLSIDQKQYPGVTAAGLMVPHYQVIRVSLPWLMLLFNCSLIMLLSAISAVILGVLRQGPDSLEYIASLLRDNRHIDVEGLGSSMMEGDELTRSMKDVALRLGDVRPDGDDGYLAITTSSDVCPLGKQPLDRLYAGSIDRVP
ncbi:hypothetical protein NW768_009710 [Fusarium equiseti]|uniref:Uncharacterized protein n=1 Tax=Fusarium equiseti TaxID=61235 RepID=A0ABQ8R281_FUSEQ|nr:hypothetical protein NW768_009710 [Fusarium equiseti]